MKYFAFIFASALMIAATSVGGAGASAQHAGTSKQVSTGQSGPRNYTPDALCTEATKRLAETDGKDAVAAEVYFSPRCQSVRDAYAFDVRDDMSDMIELLRMEGIDYASVLSRRLGQCEQSADRLMMRPVPEGKPKLIRAEVLEACRANVRTALYSEGVIALHDARVKRAARLEEERQADIRRIEREEQEAKADFARKVAADKREHERKMADWRRRVALCESGQREYCAKE